MLFLQSPEPSPRNYTILLIAKPDHDDTSVLESLRPTVLNDSTTVKSIRVTAYVYMCVYVRPIDSVLLQSSHILYIHVTIGGYH